jgi:hypothetical protein
LFLPSRPSDGVVAVICWLIVLPLTKRLCLGHNWADRRPPTADRRPPTADQRPSTNDQLTKTTKRPNN